MPANMPNLPPHHSTPKCVALGAPPVLGAEANSVAHGGGGITATQKQTSSLIRESVLWPGAPLPSVAPSWAFILSSPPHPQPVGIGASVTLPEGTSLICLGEDHGGRGSGGLRCCPAQLDFRPWPGPVLAGPHWRPTSAEQLPPPTHQLLSILQPEVAGEGQVPVWTVHKHCLKLSALPPVCPGLPTQCHPRPLSLGLILV